MSSSYFLDLFSTVTQQSRFSSEMVAAKEEFEQVAGQIQDTDNSYDARFNAFHNWYILERPLLKNGLTPLEYFLQQSADSMPEEKLASYRELADNIHSVFELVKFNKSAALLRDLMEGKKYLVKEAGLLESMEKGDIFNSRLFLHGEQYHLTNYVILHPPTVYKSIKANAKKLRKAKGEVKTFLYRLLFFHSRWEQFSQMEVGNIYRFQDPTPARRPA